MGRLENVFEARLVGLQTHTALASLLGKKCQIHMLPSVKYAVRRNLSSCLPDVLHFGVSTAEFLLSCQTKPCSRTMLFLSSTLSSLIIWSFTFYGLLKVQPIIFVSMHKKIKTKHWMCSWISKRNSELKKTLFSQSIMTKQSLSDMKSLKIFFRHLYLILLWNVLR